MISEDVIQKIKSESDIVDIISETVRLKKAGRNYSGLCPFHHEKTPSFSVSPDKGIYKCFGCGEAGNVITFVMKTRNLNFVDALKLLAEKANIELELEKDKHDANSYINKIYKLNKEAGRYYFFNLRRNKEALNYFLRRGIVQQTINKFGLGYAENSWNSTQKYLLSKGYSEKELIDAGLLKKNEKGNTYDRFRGRVMFPVFDYRGNVIGFGGRVLDDSLPKYLNSPETYLFKKGTNLYGLNFAIKSGINDKTLIIVEGYMDCIALHQSGITNVVASLGTALTVKQAKLMKKYAEKIIISYDADFAGQNATLRGLQILKEEGFDLRVLKIPNSKDPDEYVKNNGKEAFLELINKALPLIDYRLEALKDGMDLLKDQDNMEYSIKAVSMLMELNPVERDIYIKKVSEFTGRKEEALYDLYNNNKKKQYEKGENAYEIDIKSKYLEPSHLKAARSLLKLAITEEEITQDVLEVLDDELMVNNEQKKILEFIKEIAYNDSIENLKSKIENKCIEIDTSGELVNILETEIICEKTKLSSLIGDCIYTIRKFNLEESKKIIMSKIKNCEAEGKTSEILQLMKELKENMKTLKNMEKDR